MRDNIQLTKVIDFWRVLPRGIGFGLPDLRYQGEGRFDDPGRLVPVLYGAGSLETAIYETIDAYGVIAHERAAAILSAIPEPSTDQEKDDAKLDRLIASAPRRIPPSFYGRRAVFVRPSAGELNGYDLRDVRNRRIITETTSVAAVIGSRTFEEVDVSRITSDDRELTQAIANELIRGTLAEYADGIVTPSRRSGEIYAFFCDGRFPFDFQELHQTELFTPQLAIIRSIAQALGLVP